MNSQTQVTAEQAEAAQKNLTAPKAPKGPVVYVGCKLPTGLMIQHGDESFILNGSNDSSIVGGYGITAVPKDLWDAWYAQHSKHFEPLKRDLIFVQDKESSARSAAAERSGIKGIEGVDVSRPAPGAVKADQEV